MKPLHNFPSSRTGLKTLASAFLPALSPAVSPAVSPARSSALSSALSPVLSSALLALAGLGCEPERELAPEEWEQLDDMVYTGALLASPSNEYADDLEASTLGQRLFFDENMSSDGTVSCASCHDPAQAFSDPDRVSLGVRDQRGDRHAPPIVNPGAQTFFLWDGRADSLWSQALMAIENPVEMDLSRVEVAHYITHTYADAYTAIFGPLPDLSHLPDRAQPGDGAWEELSERDKRSVGVIFTNIAKAIEAYERRLSCVNTHFDRVMQGEETFTPEEEQGAVEFIRAGCVNCHGGPQFNESPDGELFHNLGLSTDPDEGRSAVIETLLNNPFNAAGAFSDDPEVGSARLANLNASGRLVAAFKTPSLRGVTQRPRFFHDGSRTSIRQVLDFYRDQGRRGRRSDQPAGVISEEFQNLGRFDDRALEAFLHTLDCPDIDPELIDPDVSLSSPSN